MKDESSVDPCMADPHVGWDADTDFVAPIGGYPEMDALWDTRRSERRAGSGNRRQTERPEPHKRRATPD